MPGYISHLFRYRCDDRGLCFLKTLVDASDLTIAFPRKIHPTDVDAMVEINDRFLFMEFKAAGKRLDEGQRLALVRLHNLIPDRITLMFIREGGPLGWQKLQFPNPDKFKDQTREDIILDVVKWATDAEAVR